MANYIKFGRRYELHVQVDPDNFIVIRPPITIDFDIQRQLMGALNQSKIRVYNLNPNTREQIRYDSSFYGNVQSNRYIYVYAGYGDNLPLIFTGNITEAYSQREGVDFITTISAFDGGAANTSGVIQETLTFPAGTPQQSFLETLMGKGLMPEANTFLPGVTFGAIGDSYIKNDSGLIVKTRADSVTGNTIANLKDRVLNAFFIDNGKCFILGTPECRQGEIPEISAATGLLATVARESSIITFDTIFEPSVVIGQLINLNSTTNSSFNSAQNGPYKINAFRHRGMISEAVCGEVITTFEFIFGGGKLIPVTQQ